MTQKLVIGPIDKGIQTNRTAFNIDNDSFPQLLNAYQWRGRIKRKRGTSLLTRLNRQIKVNGSSLTANSINLISTFNLETNSSITPGSINIVGGTDGTTYTDPGGTGVLTATSGTGTGGTINYATGLLTITSGATETLTGTFSYYPTLPVMGLEDFVTGAAQNPQSIAFDTTYSYNILTVLPYNSYDVSFYKNPPTATYVGYTQKTTDTPVTWNGQSYQQFWTTNYQGALWATNGVSVPFSITNLGMPFKPIVSVTVTTVGPPAIVSLNITTHGLVVGDFLFINEVVSTTGINWQTGYVKTVTDANNVVVEFPNATIATNGTGGIAQYLTNVPDNTKDCMRWYDGDPTTTANGWVNFCPPLSQSIFSISDSPELVYYLVSARLVYQFKDRLVFFGPIIQSKDSSPIYLSDTIVYSQNGTPYYTCSFTNSPTATVDNPTSATNQYFPILTPLNQSATPSAYFEDSFGFGGNINSGIDQDIISVSPNQDVLIVGFTRTQTKLVYTDNDLIPFNFFIINSEYGSNSTFSAITTNDGVISRGDRGYILTTQQSCERIDLPIPDQVFEMSLLNNGSQRFCAQRDFINEWIYFTYPQNDNANIFPNQTLLFNYRDNSWSIFNESYTTYGSFKKRTGFTWATVGSIYKSWSVWNVPWNSSSSTPLQPLVIAGNQQGFVMVREGSTNEATSLSIASISASVITSPNHGLSTNDYFIISGCLGTVGDQVNGMIFSAANVTLNTFALNPLIAGGTYLGGGLITRLYIPIIQTKQFPTVWEMGRKTRIGAQQYLLSKTANGQITLFIYLSQNSSTPYNEGLILPDPESENDSLIYSTIVYTCPESDNIGLTPANTNLQTPTASQQSQIWHRMNTSLIGDTVQLGFTLSDAQMRDPTMSNQQVEIEIHSIILNISPSQLLV